MSVKNKLLTLDSVLDDQRYALFDHLVCSLDAVCQVLEFDTRYPLLYYAGEEWVRGVRDTPMGVV